MNEAVETEQPTQWKPSIKQRINMWIRKWIGGPIRSIKDKVRRFILKRKIARAKKEGATTARMIIELEIAGLFGKDGDFYGGMTGYAVAELLLKFQEAGHSGMSASLTAQIFHNLIKGEVLSPLKGTPDEWTCVVDREERTGKPMYQNRRNSAVFASGENGEDAYYIDGKIFRDKDGNGWNRGKDSRVPLTFPCIPKTEYVETGE